MNDEIIKIREQIVALSKDDTETQKLLDKLTEEVIDDANIKSPFHVGDNDIEETKDLDVLNIHKTHNGYCIVYKGGYRILIDNEMRTTCGAIEMLMNGVPEDIKEDEDRKGYEIAISAIDMIFRLPMFIFANPESTFTAAEVGAKYLQFLQETGAVPTAESENKEYDKFITQMTELMENFAKGLEKQGKEYEERMSDK